MKIAPSALRRLFALSLFTLAAGCSSGPEPDGIATLDGSEVFGGSLAISGVVELPADVPAGSGIQLSVRGDGPDFAGSVAGPAGVTEGDSVVYEITGLRPNGEYTLWVRIDATGDGKFGQADDVEGFYNGTVEAPVKLVEEADVVEVGAASVEGVDFGIGKVADIPEE